MDFSGSEEEQESQQSESLHLELEDTEIDSLELECSDIDSTFVSTPTKKRKSARARVLRPLSPNSDTGSDSDSILKSKGKHTQSSQNKEYEATQTPSTCGKKSSLGALRRSPRKRPSNTSRITREMMEESDKELKTDVDTPSSSWTVASALTLRRSPRKKQSTRETARINVDNRHKTPRSIQLPSENSQELVTPRRTSSKGIQGQLKEMQVTQKEILSTMKVVRNEIRDLKREWEK